MPLQIAQLRAAVRRCPNFGFHGVRPLTIEPKYSGLAAASFVMICDASLPTNWFALVVAAQHFLVVRAPAITAAKLGDGSIRKLGALRPKCLAMQVNVGLRPIVP